MISLRAAVVMLALSAVAAAEPGKRTDDGPLPFPVFPETSSTAPVPQSDASQSVSPIVEQASGVSNAAGAAEVPDSDKPAAAANGESAIVPPPPAVKQAGLEEIADLRLPDLSPGGKISEGIPFVEPSWLNEVIDDHRLLWQPVHSSNDFVFRDRNGFGITTLGFKSDLFADEGPIWTDLSFGWHFLSGPKQPDVPAQVYDLSLGVHVAKQVDPSWTVHFHLAPTLSTDWDNKSTDAFRLIGGALVSYQATPVTSGVLGFSYLDRPDLPVLPIAGVRWMVTDEVLADILIPEPKIAYLLKTTDSGTTWLYLKGEIGGGSWAIESTPDYDDRLGYRDARLLFGLETALVDGDRNVLEFGYIFDRQLHFDRRNQTQHLGSTWSFRWGRTF